MNALPSTEFRKSFARLTAPTMVTVNGHVIGEWRPATGDLGMTHSERTEATQIARKFTPAPKPARR